MMAEGWDADAVRARGIEDRLSFARLNGFSIDD
jgi:hypothetical protein